MLDYQCTSPAAVIGYVHGRAKKDETKKNEEKRWGKKRRGDAKESERCNEVSRTHKCDKRASRSLASNYLGHCIAFPNA
jgi:hypothetical protein